MSDSSQTPQTAQATITRTGPGGSMRRGNRWGVTLADGTFLWAHLGGRGPRTLKIPTLQLGTQVTVEWLPGTDRCRIVSTYAFQWVSPSKVKRMSVSNSLRQLAALIDSPRFLKRLPEDEEERISLLDLRDAEAFDTAWVRANQRLGSNPESRERRELCKQAFMRCMQLTKDPDMSAYVSDDFGLLAGAIEQDVNERWLVALWRAYFDGEFPAGELTLPKKALLREVVELTPLNEYDQQ